MFTLIEYMAFILLGIFYVQFTLIKT